MSGPLRIRDARQTDEPALRALTETGMDGLVRLAFPQAPDFFAAEKIRGETRLGILTDDSDAVLGCGARVVRRAWLAGAWQRTGYYCTLRAGSAGRNVRAVKTAYTWARKVEASDPLPLVTSTILSDNARALRLLTSRRFGLPAYLPAGEIVTFTATPCAVRSLGGGDAIESVSGTEVGEDALRAFYACAEGRPPLFPELTDPFPPGLALSDFIVLRRAGRIVAAAALWDQRQQRQVRILGYAPWLRVLRPFANVGLACFGLPRLPPPGGELAVRYLAFRRIPSGEPALFIALLRAAASRVPRGEVLSFSLHERDVQMATLVRLRALRTRSHLFTLSYGEDPQPVVFPSAPYIEAAML